jgi:hypothetical protein
MIKHKIKLPPALVAALETLAKQDGMSLEQLFTTLLAESLADRLRQRGRE